MSTVTKENYLKALFFLDQKDRNITVSDLGKTMKVSKPTVSDMVKKLEGKGWVHYQKYKPLQLTEEGRRRAALIVRKHRLTEMFLVQIMGFGWEEVHEIAEELEHLNSDVLFDRMEELLGFPSVDPHGSPIPDKHGNFRELNYVLLSQIPAGSQVVLRGLRDSSKEFLLFLNSKKLALGTVIDLHHIEDFDKSVVLSYGDVTGQVFSQSVASRLLVERKA